jgi:ATP-dependent Clp protease ATP-binding subunit ClpC
MNESTLTQLKIIVERAVRPVRASVARKRKMREELLAHVVGVFEEEAKLGDEPAALARTRERFGQAAELAETLQASVPPSDRVERLAENLFGGSGESVICLAARFAAAFGVLVSVLLGIMILIDVLRGLGSEWLTVARVPSLLAPLWTVFITFGGTLLTYGMGRALFRPAGRSWLQASLVAVAAWLLVPVSSFPLYLAVSGQFRISPRQGMGEPANRVSVGPHLQGLSSLLRKRYHEKWAQLDIA